MRRIRFAALATVCVCTCTGYSAAIYVNGTTGNDSWSGLCETYSGGDCGPKATIQAGIDAAIDGDEVIVAAGTYAGTGNKDLDFAGRAITLRGAGSNPAACVIDCEDDGRGFTFHSGEGPASTVRNLTIVNGFVLDHGGGVLCENASSPTFRACVLSGNTAGDWSGGGVYCDGSSPTFSDCTFTNNDAATGGGITCTFGSHVTLTRCTVAGNTGESTGGAVLVGYDCDLTLSECAITGNSAYNGAGLVVFMSEATVEKCVFRGNTAAGVSGAVFCAPGGDVTMTDCEIIGNSAADIGGGVNCSDGNLTLHRCTLSHNEAAIDGGGAYCDSGSLTLTHCILWANVPEEVTYHGDPSHPSPSITFCTIQNGTGQPWFGPDCIDSDPLFVDPDGPDNNPDTWVDNDYRLSAASPCIDTGHPAHDPGFGAVDLDGLKRIWDGDDDGTAIVDMGAYEFGSFRFGDMDCDGLINAGDIDPFICALVDSCDYPATYPECDELLADLDANGLVNAGDIDPFIAVLAGP